VHELSASLVSLRVSNIYDLSSKILLLKFAKPDVKKQLLIDSGFRCHLTDFVRTTAAAPSVFVQKLRKCLKTRRLTAVSQIGTDRIIEFQFSDGQYRLYLEFFASGNVILTDNELKILTLLRNVPEGEGQEPQRPGLTYSLENRQNYGGVPDLTKERVHAALKTVVERSASAAAAGKKIKKKPGDELRKGLATTITELPPILVDHALKTTGFDSTAQPAAVLEDEELLDHLLRSLETARKIVGDVTSSDTCKGYIFAKKRPGSTSESADAKEGQSIYEGLLYEDFHPFIPQQLQEDSGYTVLDFDNYNKMVDEFFSSVEGQKLESKLSEREAAAKRKLDAAKADQAKRIEGLQESQLLHMRKAAAIQANVERVQEAMDAVNGLIAQGMDWVDIGKLIDRERRRNNPVAAIIALPLKLSENTITLLLGEAEAEEEDEEEAYETDSSDSESDFAGSVFSKNTVDKRLTVDIDLGITPWANAREYYGEKKSAAVKEQKTVQQSEIALKNAEQKIAAELKKGLKQEKPLLQPLRKQMWFEKFLWFISSDGYLVLGGKDASQNEILYRRYLKKGDVYVHADLHGAPSVIIKNNPQTPDAPIPPSTLSQAGHLSVCASSAWDSKAGMSAYWVNAEQVSKSAPTGEFLSTGSFMVRGKKNFLPPAQLILGFGIIFKISEESKAKHVKHRLHADEKPTTPSPERVATPGEVVDDDDKSYDGHDSEVEDNGEGPDKDHDTRENPLQSSGKDDTELDAIDEEEPAPTEQINKLALEDEKPESSTAQDTADQVDDEEAEEDADEEDEAKTETATPKAASGASTPQPTSQKKQQPKRGQRNKAKKIAAKYKDQDEDDRAAIEELIGATVGQKRKEAEEKAKAEREAAQAAAKERRRAQHQRQQRETAEHEEVRKVMLEEGVPVLDADEAEKVTPLDSLVGAPLVGDEILEAIAFCAPYSAMGKLKFKVKIQPGTQKRGKAVKEVLDLWKTAMTKKGVIDETSQDKERIWPREAELIKALKPEDAVNAVPVGKLRVMLSGGIGGSGGNDKGKDKGKGKGGGGSGKGKKK
jgi:predicted ribosome quality control (RQC) complex YloA/Tae2 family protein